MHKKEGSKRVFKVMVLGDSGVGKSSILEQYVNNTFTGLYKVTIGSDFLAKDLNLGDKKVKFQIWDTAGQERYRSLGVAYYRGADACLLVYDVSDKLSFRNLNSWLENFYQQIPESKQRSLPIVLASNKVDKKSRLVSLEAAKKWCQEHDDMPHFETSAKTRQGIDAAFEKIATMLLSLSSDE